MPFSPNIPTFNETALIFRYNNITGLWVPDPAPTICQHWGPPKTQQLVWVDQFTETWPGPPSYQLGPIGIHFLFPKGTVVRESFDIPGGKYDYLQYTHAGFGVRTYWIIQAEPRWAGFVNEHVWTYCTRRHFTP